MSKKILINDMIRLEKAYVEQLESFRSSIIVALHDLPMTATQANELSKKPPCVAISFRQMTESWSPNDYLYEEHINKMIKIIVKAPTVEKIIESVALIIEQKSYLSNGKTIRVPNDLVNVMKNTFQDVINAYNN